MGSNSGKIGSFSLTVQYYHTQTLIMWLVATTKFVVLEGGVDPCSTTLADWLDGGHLVTV